MDCTDLDVYQFPGLQTASFWNTGGLQISVNARKEGMRESVMLPSHGHSQLISEV